MYIFSKKKYEACPICWHSKWADKANGKKVEDGKIVDANGNAVAYCLGSSRNSWCVDTEPLMKRFINEKIAVRTGTGEHLDTFLKMCEEAGLLWASGAKPTSWKPSKFFSSNEHTCVVCGFKGNSRIEHSADDFYAECGYKVIDYIDFINLEVEDKYKITITSNGKDTTSVFEVDGNIVKTATAKCNPADRFDFHTGAELAFDRLFEKKHKELDLRNLKPSDKVRVRKDLNVGQMYGRGASRNRFTMSMRPFLGLEVTISNAVHHTCDGTTEYHILEDTENYFFSPEMLENI